MSKIAFSAIVNDIRGKMGTDVFGRYRGGPTGRVKKAPRNPKTAAQRAIRGYLSRASKLYESFSAAQNASWEAYGATITRHNPVTGGTYTSSGITAFCELAVKFLQNNPNGVIPLTPPNSEFLGDSITLTAAPGTGKVTFSASGANSPGVVTELLLQKINSPNRKPNPNAYKSMMFKVFPTSPLTQDITVTAGYYVAAYRFVKITTGQATDLTPLNVQAVTFSVEESEPQFEAAAPAKSPLKKAA